MQQKREYDYLTKLVVVGESGVGKSCLISRYLNNTYQDGYLSQFAGNFIQMHETRIFEKKIKLHIWETTGDPRFNRPTLDSVLRGADGVIVAYDMTSSSFNVQEWLDAIDRYATAGIPVIILGTKSDLAVERDVYVYEQVKALAVSRGIRFFETSAKNNIQVAEAFSAIAHKAVFRKMGQNPQEQGPALSAAEQKSAEAPRPAFLSFKKKTAAESSPGMRTATYEADGKVVFKWNHAVDAILKRQGDAYKFSPLHLRLYTITKETAKLLADNHNVKKLILADGTQFEEGALSELLKSKTLKTLEIRGSLSENDKTTILNYQGEAIIPNRDFYISLIEQAIKDYKKSCGVLHGQSKASHNFIKNFKERKVDWQIDPRLAELVVSNFTLRNPTTSLCKFLLPLVVSPRLADWYENRDALEESKALPDENPSPRAPLTPLLAPRDLPSVAQAQTPLVRAQDLPAQALPARLNDNNFFAYPAPVSSPSRVEVYPQSPQPVTMHVAPSAPLESKISPEEADFMKKCSKNVREYLTRLKADKTRKIPSEVIKEFSEQEIEFLEKKYPKLFDKVVSLSIIDTPVVINEQVYDLETALSLLKNGMDPQRVEFSAIEVGAGRAYLELFETAVKEIHDLRRAAASQVAPSAPVLVSEEPVGPPGGLGFN